MHCRAWLRNRRTLFMRKTRIFLFGDITCICCLLTAPCVQGLGCGRGGGFECLDKGKSGRAHQRSYSKLKNPRAPILILRPRSHRRRTPSNKQMEILERTGCEWEYSPSKHASKDLQAKQLCLPVLCELGVILWLTNLFSVGRQEKPRSASLI